MKYKDNVAILFQDNHILVSVKDAPMLTQKDQTDRISLEEILQEILQQETGKEKLFLQSIHRLDYLVSGLVLFAKSSKALQRLQQMQRDREIEKIYYALVEGVLPIKEQELVHTLKKRSHKAHFSKEGKEARLHYQVIREEEGNSLCKIKLLTGRYHQIRAQFSLLGHPVVGDEKYGSKKKKKRISLHHAELRLIHPVKKEKMEFIDKSAPFLAKHLS